jgi:superfamily II DNA/RNA helicase/HKD family nuclease
MTNSTDLKFFTNTDTDSLYKRFLSTLKDAQHFDILVGYFRTSGFNRLYEELESLDEVRILVGLSTDRKSVELFNQSNSQMELEFAAPRRCREEYSKNLIQEMEEEEDSHEVEISAAKFIEFIKSGKLKLKAHPSRDIHAKVYITRFQEGDRDFGRVITGSSNFSENGLVAQREFNVELKDRTDVHFALERFEELWAEGVDIADEYVDTIQNKTWLNDQITPYEIYLKFLYEYFKEDINVDEEVDFHLPDGFMDLAYQRQAVVSARKILDMYDGVFLADVVGLGKTFITALLLQQLPAGRKLIICPPVLKEYWTETLHDFYVPGFDVESVGKLQSLLDKGVDKYKYIVIDEAHRFRNELTQSYEMLHKICRNKKVILVSATPLNNKLEDILSQLKLFQKSRASDIPGVPNLEVFFKDRQKEINKHEKGTPEYLEAIKQTSALVRNHVLKHVMLRRTRTEIKDHFGEDILKQGLSFPDMAEPQRIIYQFDGNTEVAFNRTIALLKQFSYARYMPLVFLKEQLSEFDQQSQRNVGGFMKGILVKRLESSFYAFKQSLERFISSYERFIEMYESGTVWISSDVDVFDLLDMDDEDQLMHLMEDDKAQKYPSEAFDSNYEQKLKDDLETLHEIKSIWDKITHDPKLEFFIKELKTNPTLRDQKILLFSESKETVDYLQEKLDVVFPDEVLSYSSQGGKLCGERHKSAYLREIIEANYQPNHPNPRDDVRIVLTTDVLAEGINLHRSNIIVNYDLPWNPTRVLQRVGRVNRVGTTHDKIYVFNIFPTSQSDEHLGLEDNIIGKIQAFHNTLGEDAKYLSDEEAPETHGLFGEQLYNKLNDTDLLEDEDDGEVSELQYLKVIRTVRDEDESLFSKIKNLPKKARSARENPSKLESNNSQLLTFFRKGRLKKFALADPVMPKELMFLEAAKLFECKPKTPRQKTPKDYYDLLSANKEYLDDITNVDLNSMNAGRQGGASNEVLIIKTIKANLKFKGYTDDDETYLKLVRRALDNGSVPRNTSKRIKKALKDNLAPLKMLNILKEHIDENEIHDQLHRPKERVTREVILSEYLVGKPE